MKKINFSYLVVIGILFLFSSSFVLAAPPPQRFYTLTSKDGSVSIGIDSEWGGNVTHLRYDNQNIINNSNPGSAGATAFWLLPFSCFQYHLYSEIPNYELADCDVNINGNEARCSSSYQPPPGATGLAAKVYSCDNTLPKSGTLAGRNPTQGGYISGGYPGGYNTIGIRGNQSHPRSWYKNDPVAADDPTEFIKYYESGIHFKTGFLNYNFAGPNPIKARDVELWEMPFQLEQWVSFDEEFPSLLWLHNKLSNNTAEDQYIQNFQAATFFLRGLSTELWGYFNGPIRKLDYPNKMNIGAEALGKNLEGSSIEYPRGYFSNVNEPWISLVSELDYGVGMIVPDFLSLASSFDSSWFAGKIAVFLPYQIDLTRYPHEGVSQECPSSSSTRWGNICDTRVTQRFVPGGWAEYNFGLVIGRPEEIRRIAMYKSGVTFVNVASHFGQTNEFVDKNGDNKINEVDGVNRQGSTARFQNVFYDQNNDGKVNTVDILVLKKKIQPIGEVKVDLVEPKTFANSGNYLFDKGEKQTLRISWSSKGANYFKVSAAPFGTGNWQEIGKAEKNFLDWQVGSLNGDYQLKVEASQNWGQNYTANADSGPQKISLKTLSATDIPTITSSQVEKINDLVKITWQSSNAAWYAVYFHQNGTGKDFYLGNTRNPYLNWNFMSSTAETVQSIDAHTTIGREEIESGGNGYFIIHPSNAKDTAPGQHGYVSQGIVLPTEISHTVYR